MTETTALMGSPVSRVLGGSGGCLAPALRSFTPQAALSGPGRRLPEAPLSFVVTAARRTPAGGPSFLPGEARYACQRGFVPQIG
jgi:hypothetical protein